MNAHRRKHKTYTFNLCMYFCLLFISIDSYVSIDLFLYSRPFNTIGTILSHNFHLAFDDWFIFIDLSNVKTKIAIALTNGRWRLLDYYKIIYTTLNLQNILFLSFHFCKFHLNFLIAVLICWTRIFGFFFSFCSYHAVSFSWFMECSSFYRLQ